jgi:nucleotide-binding universal stress UspA family protein
MGRACDTEPVSTIIVCTDGSDLAARAADAALAMLKPADQVLVVTAVEGVDPLLAYDGGGHAGPTMTEAQFMEHRDAMLQAGQRTVDDATARLKADKVVGRVIEGPPGPALCALARDEGATAIVMGTRGMGGLKRAFFGSVSDFVVRNAPCPVIVLGDND